MENQKIYQKAKKRAEAKLEFYVHLGIYIAVMALLIIINLTSGATNFWAKWPLLGWGIGVFWHAMGVFVLYDKSAATEKMIKKEMDKDLV